MIEEMVWKQHPIYSQYQISEYGAVKHIKARRVRSVRLDRDGYQRVNLVHNRKHLTRAIHRLVAEAFVERDDPSHVVNHCDGDKTNNHFSNLEWIPAVENVRHAFQTGLVSACHRICIEGQTFYSKREAERRTGVSRFRMKDENEQIY